MITIQNIIDWAQPHRLGRGMKQLKIGNDNYTFSIVGGSDTTYGDFVDTFEVAVFNSDTDDYMTSFFFDKSDGMLASYVSGEELERVIAQANSKNDFQVR
jgi:hypothetical protein